MGTQAKFTINRDALAGTNLAVHNLGRLTRRGQTPKDLRAHQEDLGPRTFAGLDQRAMVVVEPVILAALALQAGTHHDLHLHLPQAERPI